MKKVLLVLLLSMFAAGYGLAQTFVTHTTTTMTASVFDSSYIGHEYNGAIGQGVKFNGGPDAMYTGGFVVGYNIAKCVGLMGSFTSGGTPAMKDWTITTPSSGFTSNTFFNQVASATYNDNGAPALNKIGLTVKQTSMSNTSDNFVILQYEITNTTASQLSGVYAAMFADWDVGGASGYPANRGGYDVARGVAYQYANGGLGDSRYYGFDALTGMGGAKVTATSAFSPTSIVRDSCFTWMKNTVYTPITVNGDMRSWISSGPYTIPAGTKITVAFAIIAGADLAGLQANSDLAQAKWLSFTTPVELTSFTAAANNNVVTLNWTTATEINNRGFEIQKKSANSDYATVGFVNGVGSSTEVHNYTFTDNTLAGTYTYRLRQVDFNGTSAFSDAVEVVVNPDRFSLNQNYPNPFNPSTKIDFTLAQAGMVKLAVYNLLGQQIETLVNEVRGAGSYSVTFNASNLTTGVYFYKLETPEFSKTMKMILNK